MKIIANFPIVLAIIALFFVSCAADRTDEPGPDTEADVAKLAEFSARHAPQIERFTLDATLGGQVTTTQGTRFTFPANAIVRANGQPVIGQVEVRVQEVRRPSEMVLSNRPTETASGDLLVSFGEFKVRLRQGNDELRLAPNRAIAVQAAAPVGIAGRVIEMPLWAGDTTITRLIAGLDWQAQPTTIQVAISASRGVVWQNAPGSATIAPNGLMSFGISENLQLNWVNCDFLLSDPRPKTTVLTYFGQNYAPATGQGSGSWQPSGLFFKPRGRNSVIKFHSTILNAPAGREGFHSVQNRMPVGMDGTFLAYSIINGKFYVEVRANVTIPTPVNGFAGLTFSPQEVTESAFLAAIRSLDTQ